MDINNCKIAVIGLGYVGLPLMVEFAKKYPTIGFDINEERINQLRNNNDRTLEISEKELKEAIKGTFTSKTMELEKCNVYIITVPTPIDKDNRPDMQALRNACNLVASALSDGDVVIFESTVYPGATEEICVPILESGSGLTLNTTLFIGYSPERINPSDKNRRLTTIIKVTSGSTPETADFVDALYASIIPAGTHKTSSIRIAEAAKVIENTQRDLNIALMNELSIIFNKMNIDTNEVLETAGTKWNFLNFKPGLVGGHCISVDPYYLTHKAQQIGYHPEIILAGRRINDSMGRYICERVIEEMTHKQIQADGSKILIMGLSFKENCPDIRNTRVADLVKCLKEFNADVELYDPWVDPIEVKKEYGFTVTENLEENHYDAIILAVAHSHFKELGIRKIKKLAKIPHVIFDVKYIFPQNENLTRL